MPNHTFTNYAMILRYQDLQQCFDCELLDLLKKNSRETSELFIGIVFAEL